jgi:hypothetical protein
MRGPSMRGVARGNRTTPSLRRGLRQWTGQGEARRYRRSEALHVGADELVRADEAMKAALQAKYDAGAITREQAEAKFKDWVGKRTKVALALEELKHAVSLAGLGISAVEAGQAKDYATVMVNLAQAMSEALKALADAGVKVL